MISRHGNRNFVGSKYKLATTDLTEYFPVYATFERNRFDSYHYDNTENEPHNKLAELIINDVYLYRKPERVSLQRNITTQNHYVNLFQALESGNGTIKYLFSYNDEPHYLNVMRGYIADNNDNILLLLTTKQYSIFDSHNTLIKAPLRLYISTELMRNEIYKNLYKRIEKEYISWFYDEDIEVIFTTSEKIEKSIFRNSFNVEFNNISELSEILLTEPQSILDYNFDEPVSIPDNRLAAVEEELPF